LNFLAVLIVAAAKELALVLLAYAATFALFLGYGFYVKHSKKHNIATTK
jgi:hypothetical protein